MIFFYFFFPFRLVNNRAVYLPIQAITANSPRCMNPRGHTIERLLFNTGQPDPFSDPNVLKAWSLLQSNKKPIHGE
jgi:hypothetical protein